MVHLLSAANYQRHKWLICIDLKVVGLIPEHQGGYPKYPCFLCLLDSQADDLHYVRQKWLLRQGLKPGSHNVQSHPLVEPNKILLPPLHIKFGVMKNFVKAMEMEDSGFVFFPEKFSWISMEKLKAGIFDGPQIRELMKDPMFDESLSKAELSAWQSLEPVVTNFLGSHWSVEYEKEIEEILKSFHQLRTQMSVKLHFLQSHLDYFQRTVEILVKSWVSAFTKTFALWKSANKVSGM